MTRFIRRKNGKLYFSDGPGREQEWTAPDPRIGDDEPRRESNFSSVYAYLMAVCPTTKMANAKIRAIRAASKMCNGMDTEAKGQRR